MLEEEEVKFINTHLMLKIMLQHVEREIVEIIMIQYLIVVVGLVFLLKHQEELMVMEELLVEEEEEEDF